MSASLTKSTSSLPSGTARPYWMDNVFATEQNGSFVPPALTTSTEKMLLVMPGSHCTSSMLLLLHQALMVFAHCMVLLHDF